MHLDVGPEVDVSDEHMEDPMELLAAKTRARRAEAERADTALAKAGREASTVQ